MSEKYKIREKEKAYFTTSTIVGWIDVFTRPNHKMAIVNSLRHCIDNAWDYLFSSARNYAGMEGLLDVHVLDHKALVKNWR